LKYYTKESAVTTYSGKLVSDNFLAIINPAMLTFKPEARPVWDRSKKSILDYLSGNVETIIIDDNIACGIKDTDEINKYLKKAIKYKCDYVAVDTETTGLYPRDGYVQGISVSYDGKKGIYVDADCLDNVSENLFQKLFNKKRVIFHNAKFDLAMLEHHFNFKFPKFEDTMLLHYLIDEVPGTHGLKDLAMRYTPYGDYEKPLYAWMEGYRKTHGILKGDFRWGDIPFSEIYTYAAMDALVTFQLYELFRKILNNKKLKEVYNNILIPGCRFLTDIQDNGVPFDKPRLLEAQELMQHDIDKAIAALYKHKEVQEFERFQGKDFNPNSVPQLRTLLFDFLKLPPTGIKTAKEADSTNAEVLEILSEKSEVPKLILDIRQKSKIKNTYLDKIIPQLDRDSRLRTNFNLHTTVAGRLSSSGKLNMQQLPRDNPIIKGCIKAAPGHKIVSMDLTTAEMYVAAVLSEDENLKDVFRSGGNFHSQMAKEIFKLDCPADQIAEVYTQLRQAVKAVSFGILYGAGAKKISQQVSKDSGKYFSIQEAQGAINDYFKSFPKLKSWLKANKDFIGKNSYIYSFFGRKRRLPNVQSENLGIVGHNLRSGLNFLVQSVASDINLLGAIDMHAHIKATGMKSRIFALVHDSILAEVPEEEVEDYSASLLHYVQLDRGIYIPGAPVGCDFDTGEDYSFGKYKKVYGN